MNISREIGIAFEFFMNASPVTRIILELRVDISWTLMEIARIMIVEIDKAR